MIAGEDVLKTDTATDGPVTVAPRIGAFQTVVLAIPRDRTVARLLIAALQIEDPLIEDPRIEDPPIESQLMDASQSVVMGIQGPVIAVRPSIVAPEMWARVTVGLPLIVAPQAIVSQIAPQIAPPIGPIAPQGIAR